MFRDTANQVGKIAPGLIKNASSEINNITQQRINQVIKEEKKLNIFFQKFFMEQLTMFTKRCLDCLENLGKNNFTN